ncbi:TPA: hypothetical protein PFE25_004680, partial [Kluyvera ascorbata]|nr:hypothetical protein [Kluyvera ascorbata]
NYVLVDDGITISGGNGGITYSSSQGAAGGSAINGDNFQLKNKGSIIGGNGGSSGMGGYFSNGIAIGGSGGDGISGTNISIINYADGKISGGGYSLADINSPVNYYSTALGDNSIGGKGGNGISGSIISITNYGDILGGVGGTAHSGSDLKSTGGDGGYGIKGVGININNNGTITGGAGGIGSNYKTGTTGGRGGNAISGVNISINNSGEIKGGNGGKVVSLTDVLSTTDAGGNGGDAIEGSYINITNSGTISRGEGYSLSSITNGTPGAAIRLTSGENKLTLKDGSIITGDIILSPTDTDTTNTLLITSDDATTVTGNLTASAYTGV